MVLAAPRDIKKPIARQIPTHLSAHGTRWQDDYAWLRDPDYPEVKKTDILDYLNSENAYFESVMRPEQAKIDQIYNELKGRIKEDDDSLPWREGKFDFYARFESGQNYRCYYYRDAKESPYAMGDWRILLDENKEASGRDFFHLKEIAPSPDGRFLAWSEDITGGERYRLRLRDLRSGQDWDALVDGTSGELVWDQNSKGLYYVNLSSEWRPYQVFWLDLTGLDEENIQNNQDSQINQAGTARQTSPTSAILLYEEPDAGFFVHIKETSAKRHLVIASASHDTSEAHLLPFGALPRKPSIKRSATTTPRAENPEAQQNQDLLFCVSERRAFHKYQLDEGSDGFWILSNKDHKNYGLYHWQGPSKIKKGQDVQAMSALANSEKNWRLCYQGDDRHYLKNFLVQKNRLALEERVDGQDGILLLTPQGENLGKIAFPESVYTVSFGFNADYQADFIRLSYTSLVTPLSQFDYQADTEALILRKEQEIPSGYDKSLYESCRLYFESTDGAQVPVSLVWRRDKRQAGGQALHLYGYGAYGIGMTPSFSSSRLSLLDRGMVYAIAHVRGGDELGQGWYEAGKKETRSYCFDDFIAVSKGLIAEGFAKTGQISISGGSAGGELMGAAVNAAPELYGAAVLHVPFVDVLHTMMDASLPLTPLEWGEWGNPITDKAAFELIKGYCPYSNIKKQAYPAMLVTGGLYDPRVTYWEPAKWTAKLRALKQDDHLLLLKMNMEAGHQGKSGRFEHLREIAEEYIFILLALDLA